MLNHELVHLLQQLDPLLPVVIEKDCYYAGEGHEDVDTPTVIKTTIGPAISVGSIYSQP